MFKPKWQFYEHLSFLADMITPRRTFSNLDEDSGSNYDENGENLYPDDSGFSPPGLPPKNAKGKKKMTPFEQTMVAAASTLKSISERPIQHPNQPPSAVAAAPAPKSADDLFGETVANLMSAIPDSYEKDMIKIEIEKMIYQLKHSSQRTTQPTIARGFNNNSMMMQTPPLGNSRYMNLMTSPPASTSLDSRFNG